MSDEERAQGRRERPMGKERKLLEKADTQQRVAERRLQAPRPNHLNRADDSGLRGGRDSIIRSELTSSEPPGSKPDSVRSITPKTFDGDDCGETDDEEEEHVGYEEASADGKEDDSDTNSTVYWLLERLQCDDCPGDTDLHLLSLWLLCVLFYS